MNEIEIQTAETSETLEKRDKDWEELCAKFDEYKEKAKDRDEWERKNDELHIAFEEEEIKHLKELRNARVTKLSPHVMAMMSPDTTTQANAQEFYRSSAMTAQQRMSSSSDARITILDLSDTYLAPQFQELFEQVARATIQEIHRARDRSLGRIVSSQRVCQSPVRQERTTDLTEPAGPLLSGAKVRSRVIDTRKDLNTRSNFV